MTGKGKIGVFDSGFGGINTLRFLVSYLPEYDYVYLGDSARAPYGSRSQDVIYEFARQGTDFLFNRGCELVIFACNTASSEALKKIQHEYLPAHHVGKRVLGVLVPAVEEALVRTKNKKIGVIATESTVRSGAFTRECTARDPETLVVQRACPLLVPIVEAGEIHSEITRVVLENYLRPLIEEGIDTLILGCTHYGVLGQQIKAILGEDIIAVSEATVVPSKLQDYLSRHREFDDTLGRGGSVEFYSTDLTDTFTRLGGEFFGKEIRVDKASLG